MRLTPALLSAAATIVPAMLVAAAPATAQEATPTVNAERQVPSQGTANGAVQAGTAGRGDAAVTEDRGASAGDIIVTATRRASPLSDVPIAVSAVTQEALQNTGANDIRQLNQLAPSLLVSSTGSEANASARIRGIGTVGDNPGLESSVATFIDGVYRSRTGVGLNELGEIERVEVLRGPQGTLFGRNASAGLINIVTKSPDFTFGGVGEATYGNYDNVRLVGGLTGPIIDNLLAFRVDGVYNKRDGFYRNITQNNNESRVNDRDRYFVRGQLLFKPTEDFRVRLIGDYTHRDESCCGATYYSKYETTDPTANAVQANGSTVNSDGAVAYADTNRILGILARQGAVRPTNTVYANPFLRQVALSPGRTYRNKTKDYGGSGQIDWDLGGVNLTSITAYREYKSGNAADTDYGNVDLSVRDVGSYRQFHTFTQELRLQGSLFDGKLDWLVGGFYSHEKLRLVDSSKFGTQYGQFAACRLVATANPNVLLQNQNASGCLGTTPVAAFGGATARQAFAASFGGVGTPLANAVLAGLDRLSGTVTNGVRTGGVNNVGDTGSVYRQKSENYAFFTHNIFNITDTLSVTLGLRYTHEAKDLRANFNNNNTVCPQQQAALSPLLANAAVPAAARQFIGGIITLTCTGNSSSTLNALNLRDGFKDGEFTGTGVISWKPTPRLLTYASYAKGYKAGGYNLDRSDLGGLSGVFSPRTNADAPGLRFDAEKVDAYEVGAKYNISRAFSLNVAAFRQEFKDFQLNTFNGTVFVVQNIQGCKNDLGGADTDSLAGNGTCAGNADRAGVISQGVELEATMNPIRDLTFTAGYTYADTHFRRNLVGSAQGEALDPALFLLPGSQLSNAPKNVVTTSLAWTPDIGSNGLSALFYVDSRLTSDYNTGSDLAPEKRQDGFPLVNARIGLRGRDQLWAVEVWAQNLTNKDYIQVAFNSPFQGAGSVANTQRFGTTANALYSAFLAEPRTYGLTLRTRF